MHNYSLAQSDAKGKKVSVIIPLFNERETILEVIKAVESVPLDLEKEIIIVDDGSKDGSREVVRSLDSKYKVILKEKNEGKGSALKVGIVHSLGDYVIFQDADLEYDPNDYAKLLAPLEKNEADLVLGSRVLSGSMRLFGPKRVHFATFFGCKLIAFFINTLYGYRFTDYYGCYKSFRRETLTSVDVRANGFDYDSELLCKLLKRNIRVAEMPSSYNPRDFSKGKKLSFWRDGFKVIFSIIRWRFSK